MVVSQFISDEAVNGLLNYSKRIVDLICAHQERPCELRTLQYLIFAGMISYYGFEHIDAVTEAFKKNKFYYTKEKIADYLAKQKGISKDTLDILMQDNTCAYFYQNFFYRKSTGEYFSQGKIVVSDSKHYAPDKLLELTTHEVNHAVNAVCKAITPVGNSFISRMGVYTKDYRDNSFNKMILEESINTLQAAEIMEHILAFVDYRIDDPEIRYTLDSMRYAAGRKREGIGYIEATPVVRPLYENNRFNTILKRKRMDGNIRDISCEFDSKLGYGSFNTLATYFDGIYSSSSKTSKSNAERLVKQYVRS